MDDYDDDESISSKPYSSSGPSDVVNATGIASLDIREDNLSSHGRTWSGQPKSAGHDITEEFKHASKALYQSQLIKDDFFTLAESVAALEIGDAKMDSGMDMPDQDSVLDAFDPLSFTSPEEIIWIMDQMLCFEMQWHEGYPLSQTVFSSLHLNDLLTNQPCSLDKLSFHTGHDRISRDNHVLITILRAYCLGVAKCCHHVLEEITSEHYYEEEDFISATFNLDLLTTVNIAGVLTLLEDAELAVITLHALSADLKNALLYRLQMRKCLLQAFLPLDKSDENSFENKPKMFMQVQKLLSSVDQTATFGKATVTPVFSDRVQRYLSSNTPPRPTRQTSWTEAKHALDDICQDVIAAFQISNLGQDMYSHGLMDFILNFSSRTPEPRVYARAVMQGLLFKDGSIYNHTSHRDLLLGDIRSLVLPGSELLAAENWRVEAPSSPRYEIARLLDDFVSRSMEEYLNLYRMPLQNRCRVRRTFAQSIAILDSLQAMAEDYDADILDICQSSVLNGAVPTSHDFSPLTAWVFYHKLHAMEIVIEMGFELEVYLPDEMGLTYQFLSHISSIQQRHITTMISTHRLHLSHLEPFQSLKIKELQTSISTLQTLSSLSLLKTSLTSSLAKRYSLLYISNLIPVPAHQLSTPTLRHELRLKPFLKIGTPSLPSADELSSQLQLDDGVDLDGLFTSEMDTAREELYSLTNQSDEKISPSRAVVDLHNVMRCLDEIDSRLRRVFKDIGLKTVGDVRRDMTRRRILQEKVKIDTSSDKDDRTGWTVFKVVLLASSTL